MFYSFWILKIIFVCKQRGHNENELLSPEEVLALHQEKFYPIEVLRTDPLPPGVIPRRREDYLSPEDFEVIKTNETP